MNTFSTQQLFSETVTMSSMLIPDGAVNELDDYEYPFENIVFEGGGSKGHSYIGAIRLLEEVGIWKNLQRFAGASVGALTAAWAAFGYNSYSMEKLSSKDFKSLLQDTGYRHLLPNLQKHYGWHKGDKFTDWVGETLATAPKGNADYDITFEDLYRKSGVELCITVTNLHQMDCTYCHVKTTPDLPIRKAIRMSIAVPGIFGAVRHTLSEREEIYVDGGLLCNYPITCFDGWFLSLDPRETFLQKIPLCEDLATMWDVSSRFGTRNDKTIGILLYSQDEQEVFQIALRSRLKTYVKDYHDLEIPDTCLSRKRKEDREIQNDAKAQRATMSKAMSAFLKRLAETDTDLSGTINKAELTAAIEQGGDAFTRADAEILFGEDFNIDTLFRTLDKDDSGEITFRELTAFVEHKGLHILSLFRGFESREIKDFPSFFTAVVESLLLTMKRIFVKGEDLDRTIGIDTVYIGGMDLKTEPADREFLIKQGALGCLAFLRQYIDTNRACQRHHHASKTQDASLSDRVIPTKEEITKEGATGITNKDSIDDTSEEVEHQPDQKSIHDPQKAITNMLPH
ncbi:uncharacterized protein [Amphiura filiformis]|uniref:uncharacterized protein n=1 Tax=Amphiura filiformis TaxID=82378 RepID=UPI003B222D38